MHLTDKITSYEEYLEALVPPPNGSTTVRTVRQLYCRESNEHFTAPRAMTWTQISAEQLPFCNTVTLVPHTMFWVHREILRMHHGIYPPATNVIASLYNVPAYAQYLPHISKEDPTMVAFTASVEDGVRDRQTRMALGRFLRKYGMLIADKTIAAIEAAHRTELNPNVEFIVAETHPNEFLNAYQTITSCMSKSNASYSGGNLMHPVHGYCAPGWQLAVLRNASGNMSARSLVWINPEDPEDKRMVRTYGDVALNLFLMKKGFKNIGFEGAYLKTVRAPRHDRDGLMALVGPYLDQGTDGRTEGQRNGYGFFDGVDRIYLLNVSQKMAVPSEYRISVTNAAGIHMAAKAYPFNRPCLITGEKINPAKETFVEVRLADGTTGLAKKSAVKDWILVHDDKRPAYMAPDTPSFMHGAVRVIDNDATRVKYGYCKLNEALYPNDREWYSSVQGGLKLVVYKGDTIYVKNEDAAMVILSNLSKVYMHLTTVPADTVRVAAIDEMKTFAMANVGVVTTAANRQVVPGVHDVQQAWDGSWHYSRALKQVNLLGTKMYIPKDMTLADVQINELPPSILDMVRTAVQTVNQLPNAKKKALFTVFARQGDMLCPVNEQQGGAAIEAAYIFEYRNIPLKLVEPWLRGACDSVKITDMTEERKQSLHKYGRLILEAVDTIWAQAHPKAGAQAAAETTAA